MTLEQLLHQAETLIRPSHNLLPHGPEETFVAVWQADHPLERQGTAYQHQLSVLCAALPGAWALRPGCLSLFLDPEHDAEPLVLHEPILALEHLLAGQRLYAHPAPSLPPLEALMHFGLEAVGQWLERMGSGRDAPFPPQTPETEAYLQHWMDRFPLYAPDIYTVIGGWHNPWPDNDWSVLLDYTLLFWTLHEAEPWLEVWDEGEEFLVFQRYS